MSEKYQIGLKLRTTDGILLKQAQELFDLHYYDYIELYIVPNTFEDTCKQWKSGAMPFIIHAPHTGHDVNLAKKALRASNEKVYQEVIKFSDALASRIIIFHSGCDGTIEEAIYQVRRINDTRMHVENKPLVGLHGEKCIGVTPEEIVSIQNECKLKGFILDFGHAINSSKSFSRDYSVTMKDFLNLSPAVFHISDGDVSSEKDMHLNLGKGNFKIKELINGLPVGGRLTLETPRRPETGLDDFIMDLNYLKKAQ